jgi:hypothetical protein
MRPLIPLLLSLALVVTLALILSLALAGSVFKPSIATDLLVLCIALSIILVSSLALSIREQLKIRPGPLEVLDSQTRLTFLAPDGSRAQYVKRHLLLARVSNIHSFVEAGLSTDGMITDIRTSPGTHIQADSYLNRRSAYEVVFDMPPPAGHRFTKYLECIFVDSFPGDQESFSTSVSHPARRISIELIAHAERPFKDLALFCMSDGTFVQVPGHRLIKTVTPDNRISRVSVTIRNPRIGDNYRFFWQW